MPERSAAQYRVKSPFTTGYLSRIETTSSAIILRAGELLEYVPTENRPTFGMVRIRWHGREYSIFEKDFQERCERVGSQAGP